MGAYDHLPEAPRVPRVAVAGAGYWGAKVVRSVADCELLDLAAICDPDADRRHQLARRYGADACASLDVVLDDPAIDGVILATPSSQHAPQAMTVLDAGKHVFVEKPLALSTADALAVACKAEETGLVVMVGHIPVFTAAVIEARRIIQEGRLGNVMYAYCQRLGLGAFRADINAVWDLAPHDISMLLFVMGSTPIAVQAHWFSLLDDPQEDVGFMVVHMAGGVVAHIHNSRLDPRKVRELTVVGSEQMLVYDDMNMDAPLRLYDRGARALRQAGIRSTTESLEEFAFELRTGDVSEPKVLGREPLQEEMNHFARCMRSGERPDSDARFGAQVVALLEAAEESARRGGELVDVAQSGSGGSDE